MNAAKLKEFKDIWRPTGLDSYGIDVSTVDRVAKEISQVCKLGIEICLVIGAGNIFRGLSGAAAGMDRASATIWVC